MLDFKSNEFKQLFPNADVRNVLTSYFSTDLDYVMEDDEEGSIYHYYLIDDDEKHFIPLDNVTKELFIYVMQHGRWYKGE